PHDFIPPEGAARTYAADRGWKRQVAEMVCAARCIVMLAAVSKWVVWELKLLRKMRFQHKLFVLTARGPVRKNATWGAFAEALRQAGSQPPGDDPGAGGVVGFDGLRAVVLKNDAGSAAETVDVLCASLVLPIY